MMLEAKNLTCGYNARFLLKGINLKVNKREFWGIIGPNGSGKTTLVRALTRAIPPMDGMVSLEGKSIWRINLREFTRKVAVVSQDTHPGSMKIQDYVLLGRIPHYKTFQLLETKRDLEMAQRAMALTQVIHLKDRFLREVSGGEMQLTFIARALAQEPELLVLDEPVAHLDIGHQLRVLQLLRKLNREMGLTVAIVFHELNLASEFCDRLLLLREGKVFKIGSPQEVLTPETLGEVYRTDVLVEKNPISSRPYVIVVSSKEENTS